MREQFLIIFKYQELCNLWINITQIIVIFDYKFPKNFYLLNTMGEQFMLYVKSYFFIEQIR